MTRGWSYFRKRNDWRRHVRRWLLGGIHALSHQWFALAFVAMCAAIAAATMRVSLPWGW